MFAPTIVQSQETQTKRVEGRIVATLYHCEGCQPWRGTTAVAAEYWIVDIGRIDNPNFVAIVYELYDGGLSSAEMTKSLSFEIRTPNFPSSPETQCSPHIKRKVERKSRLVRSSPSDFKLLEKGYKGKLPSTMSDMPCYIVREFPKVIAN